MVSNAWALRSTTCLCACAVTFLVQSQPLIAYIPLCSWSLMQPAGALEDAERTVVFRLAQLAIQHFDSTCSIYRILFYFHFINLHFIKCNALVCPVRWLRTTAIECSLRGDVNYSYAKIPADSQLQLSDGVSLCEVAFGYRNPHKRGFKFTNLNSLIPRVMHTNYCSPQWHIAFIVIILRIWPKF